MRLPHPGSEITVMTAEKVLFGGLVGSLAVTLTHRVSLVSLLPNFVDILHLIGFTADGVGKGTIAAGIQSYIGNVTAGSLFAHMQSAGATGAISIWSTIGGMTLHVLGTAAGVPIIAGIAAAIYIGLYHWWYRPVSGNHRQLKCV
jgi:hypothetical protein